MLNEKMRAELDQSAITIREVLPKLWWSIYTGSMDVGFTELQAFELTKTYIMKNHYEG